MRSLGTHGNLTSILLCTKLLRDRCSRRNIDADLNSKSPCGIIFQNISILEFSVCELCLKDSFIQTMSQEKVNYKSKSMNTQIPITAYSLLFWTITWKCLLLITFHSWLQKDKNFCWAIFGHYFLSLDQKVQWYEI